MKNRKLLFATVVTLLTAGLSMPVTTLAKERVVFSGGPAGGTFQVIEYALQIPMPDNSHTSWAAADQQARTMTYHPEQQFTSDRLFEIPPDPMRGRQTVSGSWQGVEKLPIAAFQPADVPHIFVLGGCADVSRQQAERLLRPLALMDMGRRIGGGTRF